MSAIFSPPVFSEVEKTQRARILFTLLWVTMVATAVAMTGVFASQPQLTTPASDVIAMVVAAGLCLLELNRRGYTKAASVLFTLFLITIVTVKALNAGGIRSPGVTMFYVFALAAGLLLGETAGIIAALTCSAVALGLVVAEYFGVLPPQTIHYTALTYWWLNFLYMCMTVLLIRVAASTVRNAFDRMNRELTERQNAERSLQLALEAGAIGVWQWTPQTGALLWDDRMHDLYGVPRGEPVIYDTWASRVMPHQLMLQESILTDTAQTFGKSQREFRIQTDAGIRDIYAAEQGFAASAGQPARVIGINIDITARKQSEEQVRAIKDQLETLVAQARIGILVHQAFRPVKVNAEFLGMFGISESEALAITDIRNFIAQDSFPHDESYEARLRDAESRTILETRCRRKDGNWIDCEIRTFPIQWEGRPSICAMITDVTEKKRMEAQLRQSQRLEAVGQMTGGIAHDFNNLLTIMLGNAEVLERKLVEDELLCELAGMTRQAAERGAELTGRLLAFSRQQALIIRAADIKDLVADISILIRRLFSEGIELRSINAPGLWKASADVAQLESALLNLAINARDAMPKGGMLTIETANIRLSGDEVASLTSLPRPKFEAEQSDFVMIAISDTGVGMDEETRLRAFDPFFTTKDVGKGSGLGLSMVYGFIQQLGGQVRLHSEPGHGTTVRLYLPRAADDADEAADDSLEALPLTGGSERILLVEDHDLVRKQVTAQLSALGYQVVSVGDGVEALELLRTRDDFDLLFTDVVMPKGMNGRDLAREAVILQAWAARPVHLGLYRQCFGASGPARPLDKSSGQALSAAGPVFEGQVFPGPIPAKARL